jgi:hypothetical protein
VPTITATADSTKSQVRLDLDFSDIDAPLAYVTRVDPVTGASTAVRSHGVAAAVGTRAYTPMQAGYKAVLYDTEMPLDSAFYYVATAPSVTMNAAATFTGLYIDPWYATDPNVSVRVTANRSGADFLSFSTIGTVTSPTIRAEDIPATAGATFTLNATISANSSQAITFGVTFRDSTGAVLSSTTGSATVLAATSVTVSGAAPANTVSAQPYVTMTGTPASTVIVSISSITVPSNAGTATSGGVTIASLGACQLKDPLRPGNNVRVDFAFDPNPLCIPGEGIFWQSLDVEQQAPNAASFNINNQANPVVVSKARSAVTSTLTLVSRTFQDRDRLITLLAPGSPLLFQVPDEYGLPDRFISIGADSISRLFPDTRIPLRVFSLPHSVVSAPASPMQGTVGARWQDTCNRYASWGAVTTAGLTWVQVLDGLAG